MSKTSNIRSLTFFSRVIFKIIFLNSPGRDLFENGHTIFIRSKLDFLRIFEIFAVLKISNPVLSGKIPKIELERLPKATDSEFRFFVEISTGSSSQLPGEGDTRVFG